MNWISTPGATLFLVAAFIMFSVTGSLLLRVSIALAGFYLVSGGQWKRLMLCLVGFVMARFVVMWLTRPTGEDQSRPAQEAGYAP